MPVRERKRSTHCDSQISLEERLNIQNEFWNKVRQSPVSTLLLDYDGTLAPFTADRDAAFPYKGVVEALNAILESCRTRVVVVTGRRAHDIPRLLRLRTAPEVWGCHGYEYLTSGKYELKKPDEDLLRALSIVDEELEKEGLADRIEYKPGAVAVHFRGIDPEVAGEAMAAVVRVYKEYGSHCGLQLRRFDQGLEFRLPNVDKGGVVHAVVAEVPPHSPIAYLGDDETDEDAFRALPCNGLSVLVRADPRPTSASQWLRPPDELLAFLCCWAECVRGGVQCKSASRA